MLTLTSPIDIINNEIELIPKNCETVFLVVFKFENNNLNFLNIKYLAIFDTFNLASEYIKHSPSFKNLTIIEVKKNILPLPTKLAEYGLEIVYDITKRQIVRRIKGYYEIEKFNASYTLYPKPERAYLVSFVKPDSPSDQDLNTISHLENNKEAILNDIASELITSLSFMNNNSQSPHIEPIINYDTRTIKLRILGLENAVVNVVNFISPQDLDQIRFEYFQYLQQPTGDATRLIHMIKSKVDTYL